MSDNEPPNKTDEMQRFTATGRPFKPPSPSKQGYAMNAIAGTASWGAAPANFLPVKFHDDSLIPVPVLRPEVAGKAEPLQKKNKSFLSSRRKSENANFTVKHIPRGEYLKYYAEDPDSGSYTGSEDLAADCILRGDDVIKYRREGLKFEDAIQDRWMPQEEKVLR